MNKDCSILTPTLMAISVVSFSFSRAAQPEARGPSSLLDAIFLYRIFAPTGLISKLTQTSYAELYYCFTPTQSILIASQAGIATSGVFGLACLIIIKQKQLSCSSEVTLFRCISFWLYCGILTLSVIISQACQRNLWSGSKVNIQQSVYTQLNNKYFYF